MYLDNLTLAGVVTVIAIVVFMLRLRRAASDGRRLQGDTPEEA